MRLGSERMERVGKLEPEIYHTAHRCVKTDYYRILIKTSQFIKLKEAAVVHVSLLCGYN